MLRVQPRVDNRPKRGFGARRTACLDLIFWHWRPVCGHLSAKGSSVPTDSGIGFRLSAIRAGSEDQLLASLQEKVLATMQVHARKKTSPRHHVLFLLCAALGVLSTEANANPNASAPQDDILEVIDLPLAADLATGSGLSESEIKESLDIAQDGEMGAGVISEVLVAEADAVKIRGKKKGLPQWLMKRWAAGVRGVELKAEVRGRPEQAKLHPAEKKAIRDRIKKLQEQRKAERKARVSKIKEQRKAGKPVKFRGKSTHARLKQAKGAKHGQQVAEQAKENGKPGQEAAQDHAAAPTKSGKGHSGKPGKPGKPGEPGKSGKHGKAGKQASSGSPGHGKSSKHASGHKSSKSKKKGRGKHK